MLRRREPPKNHGGTVALLLILIIFLCGIITVLGILNVRLFQKLNTRRESEQSISFATGAAALPTEAATFPTESVDAALGEDTPTIDLQKCPQGVDNVPAEGALSLQEIYSRNIDSVVSITSVGQSATSTGTGVILTEDGYIVTNCHVVENGISVTAQLTDGRTLPAMLVGADSVSDLAVLHVDATGLTPAQFGDSDSLRVGDTILGAIRALGEEKDIFFLFAGHGNKMEKLREIIAGEGIENVRIFSFLHGQNFQDALAVSDCALVSLEKGATGLCVPSKTYSYMMQGIPLLAIMDECDIVRDIQSGAGLWVRNGESQRLAEAVRFLRDNPEKARDMRRKCRELYLQKYTTEICTGKYVSLFRELLHPETGEENEL